MNQQTIVCDTSLLLYLGRIDHVHLLTQMFQEVATPEQVVWELDAGRAQRTDTLNPRLVNGLSIVTLDVHEIEQLPENHLGMGEQSVLAYAQNRNAAIAGLDDRQARIFARSLGLTVVGTVGILIRAKQQGFVHSARPLLDGIRSEGFHMRDELYSAALVLADE